MKEKTILLINCPNCDKEHKIESNYGYGGTCRVGDLSYKVAEDLDGDEVICDCGKTIILESEISAYMWVGIKGE